jgi:hypothetical protein
VLRLTNQADTPIRATKNGVSVCVWANQRRVFERANRTHTEEFYQVTPYSLELRKLNRELRDWELTYNTVHPTKRWANYLNDGQKKVILRDPSRTSRWLPS